MSQPNNTSLSQKVLRGTFWTMAMRWLSRFLGILSMAVVARLLTPEDFGIIAVTTALIGLMDAFTDLGADTALIRHPNPQPSHYNTVWTFTVITHSVSALLIAVCGYFSSLLYPDPRYQQVLYVMALSMLIAGLTNIGIADFRRHLQYHKDFQLNVAVQVIAIATTIACAFWLRSYWALVFGGLSRSLGRVALSYALHPYRPRLCLTERRQMFGFSFWIMLRAVAIFLTNKADRLVLAAYYKPALLGLYAIAGELASLAVFELLHPIGRVLLPALATKQNDRPWLENNFKKMCNISATLATASGVGLAAVATPALTLLYGQPYAAAADYLVLLALLATLEGFSQPIGQYLLLLNRARAYALLYIFEGIATLSVVYLLATQQFDLQYVLYGRLAVSALAFLRLFYLLRMFKSVGPLTICASWIRPMVAGAALYFGVSHLQRLLPEMPVGLLLPVLIACGALIFSFVLLLMWLLMRRPAGIEQELLQRLGLYHPRSS